jgi:alpha-L-fucosidase 2
MQVNPAARKSHTTFLNLFLAGRYAEAEELCGKNLLGTKSQFGTALPMPFLEIETILPAEADRYRRSLDLDEAIARSNSMPAT